MDTVSKDMVDHSQVTYPITYHVVGWVRMVTLLVAIVFGGGFTFTTLYPSYAHGMMVFSPVLLMFNAFVVLGVAYMVWWAFTACVVLHEDTLERRKPFVTRILPISEIAGRRVTSRGNYPVIVPRRGAPFSLDVSSYGLDARFRAWFQRLPDLNKSEHDAEMRRVQNEDAYGSTQSERVAAYSKRKRLFGQITLGLTFASYLLLLVMRLAPHAATHIIVAIALLPWCCIVLDVYFRREIALASSREAGAALAPIMLQSMLLLIVAMQYTSLIHVTDAMLGGMLAGLPLWLAFGAVSFPTQTPPSQRTGLLIFFAIIAWVWGGSALALADCFLDQHAPQIFQTHVVGGHITRGKSGVQHYLDLAPWGPEISGSSLHVSADRYAQTHRNDQVCMGLYPGRFGLPWMHSVPCVSNPIPSGAR